MAFGAAERRAQAERRRATRPCPQRPGEVPWPRRRSTLADELQQRAAGARTPIVAPPSARDGGFDLDAAYAVEARAGRGGGRPTATGRRPQGRLRQQGGVAGAQARDAGLGAHVRRHRASRAGRRGRRCRSRRWSRRRSSPRSCSSLRRPLPPGITDAGGGARRASSGSRSASRSSTASIADWKFQPADFVAAYGLHAALVVGAPMAVDAASASAACRGAGGVHGAAAAKRRRRAEQGGRAGTRCAARPCASRSWPATRHASAGAEPLAAGELVSSGTLTESRLIAPGETWTARVDGLELPDLTLRVQS